MATSIISEIDRIESGKAYLYQDTDGKWTQQSFWTDADDVQVNNIIDPGNGGAKYEGLCHGYRIGEEMPAMRGITYKKVLSKTGDYQTFVTPANKNFVHTDIKVRVYVSESSVFPSGMSQNEENGTISIEIPPFTSDLLYVIVDVCVVGNNCINI